MINQFPSGETVDRAVLARLYDLKTMLLGTVQTYYPETRAADVQPLGGTYFDGAPQAWPVLPDVPVAFAQAMTYPLQNGDVVVLLFASRGIDAAVNGGIDNDPQCTRFGHLNDCIALATGISTVANKLDPTTPDVVITQRGASILVGADATLAAARETDPVAAAVSMAAWISAVTSALAGLGVTIPAPTDFGTISSGSAVVKIA